MKTRVLALAVIASYLTLLAAAFAAEETQPSTAPAAGAPSTAPVESAVPRVESTTPRVPDGFHAAPGTRPEPYTNTGWAKEVVHDKTGIEMVFIPAGEFDMGSPVSERGRGVDEGPVHNVRITKPFYLGKYEVTQGEWQKVMGSNPSHLKGDRNPVESVEWNDCQPFLKAAGHGLVLPTEAQWEYACRAGSTTAFSFGRSDDDLGRYGWYESNSGGTIQPVGGKEPNAWGLYDMHGNVWEWCSDWYRDIYYESYPTGDPRGPASGKYRVKRGGSSDWAWMFCRSAVRGWCGPNVAGDDTGFRVARGL